MVLIHTPRTLAALARGTLKQWNSATNSQNINSSILGLSSSHPHIYSSRVGFFDFDYLGHMNNAAYLTHAEYARWEMIAENGLLWNLLRANAAFVVTANTIRYRRELHALQPFHIESAVTSLQERDIWMVHNFRSSREDPRIRAQILVKAAIVQNRKIVDPREFLAEHTSVGRTIIDALDMQNQPDSLIHEEIRDYMALEQTQRALAAKDDKRLVEETNNKA